MDSMSTLSRIKSIKHGYWENYVFVRSSHCWHAFNCMSSAHTKSLASYPYHVHQIFCILKYLFNMEKEIKINTTFLPKAIKEIN